MIISHKYKFIFIKTRKTAGTSIEVFLSQCCGESDVLTPIHPQVDPHVARNYKGIWNPLPELIEKKGKGALQVMWQLLRRKKYYNHIGAQTIEDRVSARIWNSYFKFCIERNPWDKTLSDYHMVNARSGGGMTFDDYLNRGKFCLNCHLYTDRDGNQLVDEVIQYASLTEELGRIFRKLAIPFDESLGVRAKSEHRIDRRPFQEAYTSEQKDLISRAFAKEIQMHGYTF